MGVQRQRLEYLMQRFNRTGVKTQRARSLRVESTMLERKLWSRLRNAQMEGQSFRRQHPIGPYYADFYCARLKLVVELDGGQHAMQQEQDAARTRFMQSKGLTVVRYWNSQLVESFEGVVESLRREVVRLASSRNDSPTRTPTLPSPFQGEAISLVNSHVA